MGVQAVKQWGPLHGSSGQFWVEFVHSACARVDFIKFCVTSMLICCSIIVFGPFILGTLLFLNRGRGDDALQVQSLKET